MISVRPSTHIVKDWARVVVGQFSDATADWLDGLLGDPHHDKLGLLQQCRASPQQCRVVVTREVLPAVVQHISEGYRKEGLRG